MLNALLNRLSQWFEVLPDRLRPHRKGVWTLFILLTALLGAGISDLKLDMTLESYFQKDDPMKQDLDRFRLIFGSDESSYIIYRARDGDVFSTASLQAVKGIQGDLQRYRHDLGPEASHPLDHLTEVRTLLNASYLEATEEALISRRFIGERLPTNESEREMLRRTALEHPDFPLFYFSRDSRYGGIVLRTDFGTRIKAPEAEAAAVLETVDEFGFEAEPLLDLSGDSVEVAQVSRTEGLPEYEATEMDEYVEFSRAVYAILNRPEYAEHLEYHPVGMAELYHFFIEMVMLEMGMISAGSIVLILGVLALLFRSWSAMVWPLVIIVATLIWVMGLVGWSGEPMSSMVTIIVYLILAVGVADAVHILSGYLYFRHHGQEHQQALRSTFRKSGVACVLTSVTTSIGLLALLFVPIVPISTFGIFSALGVGLALLFTLFWLPLMLDLWAPASALESEEASRMHLVQRLLRKVEPLSYRHPGIVTLLFSATGLFLLMGAFRVHVDSNMVNIIKEGVSLRETYELVDQQMSGTNNLEILVSGTRPGVLKDPEVLQAMEDLQQHLSERYPHLVTRTSSLVNVVKDSYKVLNEGRPERYQLPSDPAVLANTLFLFNNADPKERRRVVTDDYAMGRVSINLRNAGSHEYRALIDEVEAWAAQRFAPLTSRHPGLTVSATGTMALTMLLTDYISWSQIKSFGLALVVISLLLLLAFGSLRAGLVALFPNLFPILAIFGLMGWLDIPLDADTLLIAPITIGIAVDDTIHFLTHYRAEVQQRQNPQEAIIHAFRETGQAISFTSIILSLGFLIFVFSLHQGLSNFGVMSAVAFIAALLADLFLLPSLCLLADLRFSSLQPLGKET
jgi:predicted RND superfamily exporter protein